MSLKSIKTVFIFMLTMITINMTYAQPNPCDCDFTFDVVCVDDGNGNVIPFPNSCFAECEGFTAADFVDCGNGGVIDTTIVTDPCGCDFTDLTVVCVDDGNGGFIPFPNACFAECEGFTVADFVDCDFGGGIDTTVVIDTITNTIDTCGCDFTFELVCVEDTDGNVIPFPNSCFAECAGFTVADFVNCDSTIFPPFDDCYASFWYDYDYTDPLSVQFSDYSSTATSWAWDFGDGNTSTEQNPLHVYSEEGVYDVTLTITGDSCTSTITEHICIFSAGGGGGVIDTTDVCGCDFVIEPVCVEDADGNIIPFPNSCWAECEGFAVTDFVDCDFGGGVVDTTDLCGCGFEIEPVCVEDADGNIVPFPNACWAECEGFAVADFVDCDFGGGVVDTTDLCGCGFEIEPVCVNDGNGNIVPFPNACWAECEGFTVTDFVDCGFGGGVIDSTDLCGCTFDFEPVCVNDGNGNIIPFPNACIAECEGFDPADFVDCDLFDIIDSELNQVNFSVSNLSAYPNPASDVLNIFLIGNSDTEKEYRFSIQNIAGSTISSSSRIVYKGENTVQFDVSSLHSGLYFMEIQNGEEIKTIKFMK